MCLTELLVGGGLLEQKNRVIMLAPSVDENFISFIGREEGHLMD